MSQQSQNPDPQTQDTATLRRWLQPVLRAAPICLLAFVVIYRPVVSALVPEISPLAIFTMLLLAAVFAWVCSGCLRKEIFWTGGHAAIWSLVFLAWFAASCLMAPSLFNALKILCLFLSYGLTAFLVLQLTRERRIHDFLLSCLLATVVTLAGYAVLHYFVYLPALRHWVESRPDYFRELFDVRGGMFFDFLRRAQTRRAYGNFITPNQLASLLLLGIFPLAGSVLGWWQSRTSSEKSGKIPWTRFAIAIAVLLVFVTLVLTRSKGGLISFVFGGTVFSTIAFYPWVKKHLRVVLVGAVIFAGLVLAGQTAGILPGRERLSASLGVRIDYWKATADMIRERPVRGIGPGAWPEYYSMHKLPEYEETRLAHNGYLQIWSETGAIGLLLFALAIGLPLLKVARKLFTQPHEDRGDESPALDPSLTRLGLVLSGIALALDYFFVGNLNPPHVGSWKLLEAAPWIVYLAAFGLWAASFIALQSLFGSKMTRRFLLYGMLAGIAAFLLHATAEFTFRIPALGGTALVFCTLLVNHVSPGKTRHTELGDVTGALVLLPVFGIAIAWSIGIVPAARDYAFLEGEIFRLRSELSGGEEEREMGRPLSGRERLEKQQKILCLFRAALEGVRWDEPCGEMLELNPGQIRNSSWLIRSDPEKWHQRALQAVKVRTWLKAASGTPFAADDLMSESCSAARRASRMNPLKAKYKRILGRVLLDSGEEQEAIEMIRAAVQLNPTLPSAWFEAAREIEKVTRELSPFVCKAYAKALALSDRQYHDRNRLRPQLVIHRGPVRREIVLAGEEEWYLKSDRQNLVEVSKEPGARPHARLFREEGGWMLENEVGDIVPVMGERKVEDRASLSHGDAFRMGTVRFMLENPVQLIQKKLEECR